MASASSIEAPRATVIRENLKVTALIDTNKRALPGIFIFVSLWATIAFLTDLHRGHPAFVIFTLGLFILSVLLRILLFMRIDNLAVKHFTLARLCTLLLILGGALLWGTITAATIHYPSMHAAAIPMLVATPAITAGGANILSIDRALRFGYPIASMAPAVLALAFDSRNPDHLTLVFMALLSVVYFMIAPAVVQRDYWDAQRNRLLLLERARELEELSMTDPLTQLRNRLFFTTQFDVEWKRACRHGYSVAVLMLDLDHFKKVNDHHGHPFGDLCLQRTADALRGVILRAGDIVARYGGEEFIIFLSNTDPDGAAIVAQRILQAIRAVELRHGEEQVRITCSIGLASHVPARPDMGYKLINIADEMLYQAKRQGRDRVVSQIRRWEAGAGDATEHSSDSPSAGPMEQEHHS